MSPRSDDPPEHVLRHLIELLWTAQTPLQLAIVPRDAWILLGVIQYASRNPALSPDQKVIAEQAGRALQRVITQFANNDPLLARTMEQGWNPEYDR